MDDTRGAPGGGAANQADEPHVARAARQCRNAEILRRVAAGDTSVVSEVYWLQMFEGCKIEE